ncbi:TetR/AcrR family transcriptional regulator, partial [Intestinibacter sp.]|uniref:TetR/AcrR family transcriptional regulator n=1 Tax=Intestinibacter sp. TaxID=1965304 RepID=UPI003F15CFAA
KGFDNTSTNDILKEIGIARGTLYYHFKSKEDILDAIIERMNNQLATKAKVIIKNKEVPVLQRFTMAIMGLNVDNALGYEVMEQVHKTQNALMHQKMRERLLDSINPLITNLIEEGIEQGIFQTDYPAEVVDMVMLYSCIAFDSMEEYSEKERQKKIDGFIYNVERMLGMEYGSMKDAIIPLFQHSNK